MNVLVLNDSGLMGGGAETRLLQLLDYWIESGFINSVHLLHREENKQSIERPYLTAVGINDPQKRSEYVTDLCQKIKISFVQAHNLLSSGPWLFSTIAALKIPLIWFVHDFWSICGTQLFFNKSENRCHGPSMLKCSYCIGVKSMVRVRLFRKYFTNVDLAITQTNHVLKVHQENGIHPKKWLAVDPWINLTDFTDGIAEKKFSTSSPTLIFVGPNTKPKGADLAIEAFSYIRYEYSNAKLKMIGGQSHQGTWAREFATNLGIESNIEWISRLNVSDLAKQMQEADVMIFSSRCEEPFGLTWAQAMACGCPVVAVETGSIRETLNENLMEICKLDPKELAMGVMKLLKNPERLRVLSKNASDFVHDRFNLQRAAGLLEIQYKTLL